MNTPMKQKAAFFQRLKKLALSLIFIVSTQTILTPASAQQPLKTEPDTIPERTVLRFLTSNDFPPFNYYDEEDNLSGFHIDLANAICREMSVTCDVRVTDWENIQATFKSGDFDAIIAGISITKENINKLDFTSSYMRMTGRFASLKRRPQPKPSPSKVYGKKVGVVAQSAHAAYLKKFFPDAKLTHFRTQQQATTALQNGIVDYLFGDTIQLMFWLNGSLSKQCCKFTGGAYWDAGFFGEGLAIAITKGDMRLRIELNEAIHNIKKSGLFPELMLRYFPMKIY